MKKLEVFDDSLKRSLRLPRSQSDDEEKDKNKN